MKTDNDIDYAANDRFMGEAIEGLQRERDRALHAKYDNLKTSFPQIGPFGSGHWVHEGPALLYDLGTEGKAAFVSNMYSSKFLKYMEAFTTPGNRTAERTVRSDCLFRTKKTTTDLTLDRGIGILNSRTVSSCGGRTIWKRKFV